MFVDLKGTNSLLRKYLVEKEIHPRDYFELRLLENEGYIEIYKEKGKPAKGKTTKKGENVFANPDLIEIAKSKFQ